MNDAATGKPTPVRLRITNPNGEYFAPFGRVVEFPVGRNEDVGGNAYLDGKRYTYIDGTCEIRLPTGVALNVEISKGLQYPCIREIVTLGPGQMALRFSIHRAIVDRDIGWVAADTRCHSLPPQAAILEAACEDISLAYVLAAEQNYPSRDGHLYRSIPNMLAFSGQAFAHMYEPAPQAKSDGLPLHAVAVGTLNVHPALGKLGLLNCHRPVYPLTFGGDQVDDWSMCDWADQCHRKKGLVVWCEAFRTEVPGGEALVAAILGKIDAIELDAQERNRPFLMSWYRLLDAGIRLPIVGGSGKDSNRTPIGSMRTYTRMESAEWKFADWVERTRAGHTFVTNGPFLSAMVNDKLPGSVIAPLDGKPIEIRASADSLVPFERLEIVVNGSVVMSRAPTPKKENPDCHVAENTVECDLPEGGWIAARCIGAAKSMLDLRSPVLAHTSPVFVRIPGKPQRVVPAAVRSVVSDIQQVRLWVERDGRFAQEKSKTHLLALCDDALRVLSERLSEK